MSGAWKWAARPAAVSAVAVGPPAGDCDPRGSASSPPVCPCAASAISPRPGRRAGVAGDVELFPSATARTPGAAPGSQPLIL